MLVKFDNNSFFCTFSFLPSSSLIDTKSFFPGRKRLKSSLSKNSFTFTLTDTKSFFPGHKRLKSSLSKNYFTFTFVSSSASLEYPSGTARIPFSFLSFCAILMGCFVTLKNLTVFLIDQSPEKMVNSWTVSYLLQILSFSLKYLTRLKQLSQSSFSNSSSVNATTIALQNFFVNSSIFLFPCLKPLSVLMFFQRGTI